MIHHDASRSEYFTKNEALAMIGNRVRLNSGDMARVVDVFCEGENQYSLQTENHHCVAKSCRNGLCVWE